MEPQANSPVTATATKSKTRTKVIVGLAIAALAVAAAIIALNTRFAVELNQGLPTGNVMNVDQGGIR